MHRRKTGALIEASVGLAAALTPKLAPDRREALGRFAAALGLAFQIVDDILDVEGDPRLLGKTVGADEARGKPTYPAAAGMAAARARAASLHDEALAELAAFGADAAMLSWLARYIVERAS
jgi:geranylgeranyl diphosphate synthase type II